jgi:YidC/Oxa1 family membrane protein insertase
LQYPQDKKPGSPPVRLLTTDEAAFSVVRSGLRVANGGPEPTHLATFSAPDAEYRLQPGAGELRVPLTWTNGQGVTVMKTYVFRPGKYAIDVVYDIQNASTGEWKAASYMQFVRHVFSQKRSMFDVESYAYRGPAVFEGHGKRPTKLDSDDEDDVKFTQLIANGWMAEMQHHFVSAAVPPGGEQYEYTVRREGTHSLVSYRGPLKTVTAGGSAQFHEELFVGPKLQDQLKKVAPNLESTVDYGRLWWLSEPLFWVMQKVHRFVGNWGLTIIIVTILLKLLFYKLTETSGRSMAKMRAIAPRIKNIQERYKDDREQLAKQMMEIYKREKINPVAGCLPILIQIPVFLAFYWVLLESVEMRQAPFVGWIQDLSSKDPVLHPADPHGRRHVRPVQVEPRAARSDAGKDVRLHARHHDRDDGVVPGGPGAVLVYEHAALDRAAMEYQSRGRGGDKDR